MRQAELYAPQSIRLIESEQPKPASDQLLLEIARVGICGSDLHAYHGKHPFISLPVVPGHEFAGTVVDLGRDVSGFSVGQRVTIEPSLVCGKCYNCTHGRYNICENLQVIGCQTVGAMGEYLAVPASKAHIISDRLTFDQAAMIEPVAVAVHAVRKAQFDRGANVWVMGAGTIGLMTVQVARALGAEGVIVSDLIQDRLDLARELGATAVFNPRLSDSRQEIAKIFKDGADVIVECVGVTTTIHDAIKTARKGTQIILAGVFEQDTPVPLGLVQDRELELVGTLMYQYDDFPLAIELVESGEVKVDPLVTHHFPLAETAKAFATADSRGNALKVIIDVH